MVGGAGRIGSIGDVDGATTGDSARLLKARTAREALAARRLQIELDVRAGKLVDAARFEAACVERITEAKSRVESIPDRVAARLVGLDRDAITEILRGEFEAALKCLDRVPVVDDDDVVA
jgi:hypothetical protein